MLCGPFPLSPSEYKKRGSQCWSIYSNHSRTKDAPLGWRLQLLSKADFDTIIYFLLNSVTYNTCILRTLKRHCLHRFYVASTPPRDVPYFSKESVYFLLLSYASLLEWVVGGGNLISPFLILLWYIYAAACALERDSTLHHKLYITSTNQHLLGKFAFPINETIYNLYNSFSQKSYFLYMERLTLI